MLPPEVARRVASVLGESDPRHAFERIDPLAGGCVHPAARILTSSGRRAFLKWGASPGRSGFGIEARGLAALADAKGPRTPSLLGYSSGSSEARGWLLLELIETVPSTDPGGTAELLGTGLARLHRLVPGATVGWEEDGFIGTLPQANLGGEKSWARFWIDSRLQPQWSLACKHFDGRARGVWDRLMHTIEVELGGVGSDGPSLLHGDLWSGNVLTDADGAPVLVDPAVYRGDREVDLAMMELFGGFHPRVLESYRAVAPLVPGYVEVRRDIYQLYPLLVHVNLFGVGYTAGVIRRIERLLAVAG